MANFWNTAVDELYVVQHGRDQLDQFFPELYDSKDNAELPAEEFFLATEGSDFGWPYCYYDQFQEKKVLGPEYGGDGEIQERCETKSDPIMAFLAIWLPMIYCFIQAICFLKNIKMVHSLHFMVPGTEHRSHKWDILLLLFLLKVHFLQVTGKYLQTVLPEQKR